MTGTAAKLHNEMAANIVKMIVDAVSKRGGGHSEALVVAESIVFGIVLYGELTGVSSRRFSIEAVESMTEAILERLARLDLPTI